MKNLKNARLHSCILVAGDEFTKIIHETLGDNIHVKYGTDGIDIYTDDDSGMYDDINCVDTLAVHEALQEYFDVKKITSIHMDDCNWVGVWIVYTN